MARLALNPKGAVLVHEPAKPKKVSAASLEAARLAEIAGAFGLFGLALEHKVGFEAADFAYRAGAVSNQVPANDREPAARPPLPQLRHRGARIDPGLVTKFIQALDWVVVIFTAQFAALWGMDAGLSQLTIGQGAPFVLAALALKGGLWLTETYRISPAQIRPEHGVGGLALGAIAGILLANVTAPDARAAAALSASLPLAAMLLAGVHGALAVWIGAAHRAGLLAESVVIVGATDAAERLVARLAKSGEARVVAILDERLSRTPPHVGTIPVTGTLDELLVWEHLPQIDRVIIAVPPKADARVRAMIERLRVMPNQIDLLLDIEIAGVRGRGLERVGSAAFARVSGRRRDGTRAALKRTQDLVLGGVALALLALPMLAIALAVKLDSKGPALFRRRCLGLNNRVITIFRFRTLRHDPGARLVPVKSGDARITRVGGFLRSSGLDELPQVFNVLGGEMSLVGPRPHAVGAKTANRPLNQIAPDYAHRHRVKPGMVSWAQVSGAGGALRTLACVRRCVRLDLDYVGRSSLWLDGQILARATLGLFTR